MYGTVHSLFVGVPIAIDSPVPLEASGEFLADADWEAAAVFAAGFMLVGLILVKQGFDKYRTSGLIKNTATERVRSMAVGRTELNGEARAYDQTYPQPFTAGECVYGRYRIRERVKKETKDDETETVWESIAFGRFTDRMVVEDETGAVILERPSVGVSTTKTQGRVANLLEDTVLGDWFDLGPDEQTATFLEENDIPRTSSNRRRYEQTVVPPGTDLYVLGQATPREDDADEDDVVDRLQERHETFVDDLVIERDDGSGEYIVTTKDEGEIARTHLLKAVGTMCTGLFVAAIGAWMLGLALQNYGAM